eukprot:m.88850 g.88850  ORF g.88850 m.88850 type:complete len:390 (-) comp14838_c0_seq1:31-1200(-)
MKTGHCRPTTTTTKMAGVLVLLLALVSADPVWGASFTLPTFLGEVSWGLSNSISFDYASLGYPLKDTLIWSNNGGETFTNSSSRPKIAANRVASPHAASKFSYHDFGVAGEDHKTGSYDTFASQYSFNYTLGPDSVIAVVNRSKRILFKGLPANVSCAKFSCPFRFGGAASATLHDGTVLQTAIITWGGNTHSPDATSIVIYRSKDQGYTFDFLSVVANASDIPSSEEGPNEHDMVLLRNGTLFMTVRIDGGDGPLTHPYRNYYRTLSHDQGQTWSPLAKMAGVGSARPRMLLLGNGAIILSGGRHKNAGDQGPKVWVDRSGQGEVFEEYDVSYYHNLGSSQLRFTSEVNETDTARQTTCYTSLTATGEASFLIGYDVQHFGFVMHVSL